jgi:protein-arginine kinase activator protein McsA
MKICAKCGNEFAFLKYTYYYDKNGKQKILCDACRKIVEYEEKGITGRGVEYNKTKRENAKKRINFSQSQNRTCPNCGRHIPMDAVLCPYCGKRFGNF